MTKTDSILPLESLLAENRKIIDPIAKHLFFVSDPVKVTVQGVSEAKLRLHPTLEMGYRTYKVDTVFYVQKTDYDLIAKGHTLILKDLSGGIVGSAKSRKEQQNDIVQWVSDNNYVECSIIAPGELIDSEGRLNKNSMKTITGYVESYAKNLKEREIVQFERFGYCILDDKKKMQFIFISK